MTDRLLVRGYSSPCGQLLLGVVGDALCLCDWRDGRAHDRIVATLCRRLRATAAEGGSPLLERASCQLDEYFAGSRSGFDLPLRLVGTDFQCRVWRQLLDLRYGTTTSYAALAGRIGNGLAVRAAANAVGANPMSVVVPCHRVVGSDGSLRGYGGGIDKKRFLLLLEKDNAQPLNA